MRTITITKNEYLSAVSLNQPLTARQTKLYGTAIVGAFILGCVLWVYWPGVAAGALVGGSIGGFVGYWVQRLVFVPWKARKIYGQQRSLKENVEYSWSSEGLEANAETASSKTPWPNFVRWRENADVFNLYHSDTIFQIVPKRVFVGTSDEDEFRQYLSVVKNA